MKLLLIGGGGREHAIAWKLVQSPHVEQLFVAPGNGGTCALPKTENVPLAMSDLPALRNFAKERRIDLTVVGPEAPLVAGVVDLFQRAGLAIIGPSLAAARLEGSKAFSKEFMQRHAIPTARAAIFSDYGRAIDHLHQLDTPPVIKADGLAGGKGVLLPETMGEATQSIAEILLHRRFGEAGATLLLEERLHGPELSVLAFTDGESFCLLPPAQDHKRLLDGDLGPNTGGMGAFAPSPLATPALLAEVERSILRPTLAGMQTEGAPYVGVLYAGLMLTSTGPQVIEFNCRLGDPETEAVLPLVESDLVEILLACTNGTLDRVKLRLRDQSAVTVVMAAGGYPDHYTSGHPIHGLAKAEAQGALVFPAGTTHSNGQLVTSGGRVLTGTGLGATLHAAAEQAYAAVACIEFAQAHYRKDIGKRA
ncbi:MAG TPA: phosphoribosylamine--glycine ligase [Caldilineaceae bacterium]|nr:phosphoribosylamine--glycine ligase [Caldilineaceae bacterium]